MKFTCPNCHYPLQYRPEYLGRKIRCKVCRRKFRVEAPDRLILLSEAAEERQNQDQPLAPLPTEPGGENEPLQGTFSTWSDEPVSGDSRLEESQAQLDHLEHQLQSIQEELAQTHQRSEVLVDELEEARIERDRLLIRVEQLSDLEAEGLRREEEFQAAQTEIDRLRSELQEAMTIRPAAESRAEHEIRAEEADQKQGLVEELDATRADRDRFEQQLAGQAVEVSRLRQITEERDRLRDECHRRGKEIAQLNDWAESLVAEREVYAADVQSLASELDAIRSHRDRLQEDVQSVRSRLETHTSESQRLSRLTQELDTLRAERDQALIDRLEDTRRAETLRVKTEELERSHTETTQRHGQEVGNLSQAFDNARGLWEAERIAWQSQLDKERETLARDFEARLDEQRAQAAAEQQNVIEQLETSRRHFDLDHATLAEESERLARERDALRQTLEGEIAALRQERDTSQQAFEGEIAALRQERDILQQTLEGDIAALRVERDALKPLEGAHAALRLDRDALKQALEGEIAALCQDRDALKQSLEGEIAALCQERDAHKQAFENELIALRQTRDGLQQERDTALRDLKSRSQERDQWHSRCEEVEERGRVTARQYQDEIAQLTQALEQARTQHEAATRRNDELAARVRDLLSELEEQRRGREVEHKAYLQAMATFEKNMIVVREDESAEWIRTHEPPAEATQSDFETWAAEPPPPSAPPDVAVRCRRILKSFGTGNARTQALRGVDLDIYVGQLTMMVGPSGCGKTTLISIVAGTLDPDEGELQVFDSDLHRMSSQQLVRFRRKHIGFVFQQFNLLPALTAAQNAAMPLLIAGWPRRTAFARASEMLARLGLGERLHHLPAKLSGGQQQRVAIARALVHEPRLLICDEPTSALDAKSGLITMELLRDVAVQPGRAVIVVTHDSRIFDFSDRTAYMEDGHIVMVKDGPMAESHGH